MRSFLFTALFLLATPAAAADFQSQCTDNMLKGLAHGKPVSMEEFRPVVMVRCECIDRKGGKEARDALRFVWDIGTWDKAKVEAMDSPALRAKMIMAERKLGRVGAACDAEG